MSRFQWGRETENRWRQSCVLVESGWGHVTTPEGTWMKSELLPPGSAETYVWRQAKFFVREGARKRSQEPGLPGLLWTRSKLQSCWCMAGTSPLAYRSLWSPQSPNGPCLIRGLATALRPSHSVWNAQVACACSETGGCGTASWAPA